MTLSVGSLFVQGEISALENSGRLPASAYEGSTMYTSLSPCDMCTGACILYKVKRVVIGENKTFVGGEEYLKARGVEVVVFDNDECKDLMRKFIEQKPHVWYVICLPPSDMLSEFRDDSGMRTNLGSCRNEDIGEP